MNSNLGPCNAPRWMPQDLTNDKSTLVHVMAWCHQATSYYPSQCWHRSMLPYNITRLQWVNVHHFRMLLSGTASLSPCTSLRAGKLVSGLCARLSVACEKWWEFPLVTSAIYIYIYIYMNCSLSRMHWNGRYPQSMFRQANNTIHKISRMKAMSHIPLTVLHIWPAGWDCGAVYIEPGVALS